MDKKRKRSFNFSLEKQALVEKLRRDQGKPRTVAPLIPRSKAISSIPLSFSQQRLWFLNQWEPASSLYNVPVVFRLRGALQVHALEAALNTLVVRHESLRTIFPTNAGSPQQQIQPTEATSIGRLIVTKFQDTVREIHEAELPRLIAEETHQPFDLAQGPLLRARIIQVAATEAVFILTLHHIISDGWSMNVLLKELSTLYSAQVAGTPVDLPILPIQYADFSVWQREWLQGEVLAKQLTYWQQQLQGAPALLTLPTDYPRPSVQSYRGARQSVLVSPGLAQELKTLSQKEGVTLFMTGLAAFQVLLARYTGERDIVVGSPIANRTRQEIEGLIGFFVNTLVLRTRLTSTLSFRQLLHQVRATCLEAYRHQDLPFEKLVEVLQPDRDPGRNPFFQVMFQLEQAAPQSLRFTGITSKHIKATSDIAKFDLSLALVEQNNALHGTIEYSTDLFSDETITRLIGHFHTLLEGLVANPDQSFFSVPLLTEAERQQQLVDWNAATTTYPAESCVHPLFEAQVARTPEAVAVVFEAEQLTYAHLNQRANQLAHYLQREGVGPETRIGVCLERSVDLIVSLLAILKAGGAYVPLDPSYPQERLAYIMEDAGLRCLVTTAALQTRLPLGNHRIIAVDSENTRILHETERNLQTRVSPENLAYVIYTSGSTGHPKGVGVTHQNVIRLLQATHEVIHPTAQDVWTLFHSYAFDFSVWEFWGALRYGGQLVVIPSAISRAPDAFHQLLSTYQVTILNQTPSAFRQLSEHMQALGHSKPPALRLIIFGGEAVEVASLRLWMSQYGDIQPRLLNMYGITETTVHVTHHQVTSEEVADTRGGLIGTPLPDLQVYLLDAHDQLVPQGVSGELHIGGGGLARGYLNRPALTAARFRPNPFTTKVGQRLYQSGDVGRYGEAGQLHYLGRNDGQVKLRGFRIELGEIEAALRHQPTIKETLVLCREDRPGDKHLVAYVVPTPNVSLDATTLRTTLKTLLPEYMVPTVFMLLDVLPLTPNGKVDRKALPTPKTTDRSHEKTYVAPQTPTEKTLVKIWQTVLNVSQIGVQDNFFELGGHSLLATQVVSRVGALTHKTVSVRTIFDCPTIAQLASNLEDLQSQQDGDLAPPLRPQDQKGLIPLSFAQQRLWFLDQWQPNSALYNVSSVFRLRGLLRVDALRNALRTLIGRHESLRTIFHVVDGMPRQHIQRLEELPSPCLTIMEMPNEAGETREAMLQRFIIKETHKPFDLTQGPLFRAILLPVDETETVFIVTLHHIITDGWSMEILLKELAVLYAAEITGTPANLPALPIQYVDYAVWQRDWLQGDVLTKQLTYWRTELTDAPPSIELSTDFPRPAELSYRGERISFTLPPLLTRSLKKLSQREGATMFMILLAAFQVLLFRYTGQRDILVGTPLAGRTHREMEGLIGFFVNTLVIRTQLKDQLPFQNVLQQVKTTCLNAFAHQDVPFEKLVEILQPTRDPSRHPLFQVMFQLQHGDSTSELTLQNLEVHSLPQVGQTAKFDIALGLLVKGEILEGTVTFNTDLFESATIKRLTMHYHRLLEGLVANPTHVVSQMPLLTKAEVHQLLMEWNPPGSQDSPALYVHQLFETQAARTPDTVAIVFEDEHLTYEALNNEVNRLANYLAKQGIGPEMRVAFCLERSINLLIAHLGILKAGAVYVPLDPSTPVDRMAFILTEAQICLGLTQLSLLNKFNTQKSSENVEPLLLPQWVAMDDPDCGIHSYDCSDLRPIVGPDNLAYVMYTSGSTGQPKGVMITHANVSQFVLSASKYLEIQTCDRVLQFASLSFDAAVEEIFPCLLRGGTLVLKTENMIDTVSTFWEEVTRWQLTVLDLPTAYWHELTSALSVQTIRIPNSLRLVVIGGEQARADQMKVWHQYMPSHVKLLNAYGPTEATVVAAWGHLSNPFTKGRQKPFSTVSIGRALENRTIYILDPHGEPTPIGVPGELFLGGRGLGRGYDYKQELTAAAFVPDPFSRQPGARLYRTGDRGRYRADGTIELIGRIDRQVKIRGYRIELEEIESCLRDIAEIEEALVIVQSNEQGQASLVAYVMSRLPQPLSIARIRQFLQSKLPHFMVPGGIFQLEKFPRLPSGKINRHALSRYSPSASTTEIAHREPETAVEEMLVQIWRELLDLPAVTVQDNFFELGGHSLLATRLLARLRGIGQSDLPLRIIFEHPILEDQALAIEEHLLKEIEDLPKDEFLNIEDA